VLSVVCVYGCVCVDLRSCVQVCLFVGVYRLSVVCVYGCCVLSVACVHGCVCVELRSCTGLCLFEQRRFSTSLVVECACACLVACVCVYLVSVVCVYVGQTDPAKGQITRLRGRSLPLTTRATDVAPHWCVLTCDLVYRSACLCVSMCM